MFSSENKDTKCVNSLNFSSKSPMGRAIHSPIEKRCPRGGDSKLCFRLTENERFNGEYADKPFQPLPPESVCL